MIDNCRLVLSVTTYPKRLEYFRKAFAGLMRQTYIDKVDVISLNLDDSLKPGEVVLYDEFAKTDPRVEVKLRDHRWKSANKLVWTYREYGADSAIVCFDDDKDYPAECLRQLCEAWRRDRDCIIAQEVNPAVVRNGALQYLNAVDVKLGQREFGKYLSNACLFPPGCFGDGLYDYEGFQYVTNGMHDELWFWIMSTMQFFCHIFYTKSLAGQ